MRAHRPFVVLLVLWFTYFWSFSCPQVITALMPVIQGSLSLSTADIGLLIGLYSLGFVFGYFVSGFQCTRLGRTKTIVLSVVIVTLCMLLISLFTSYLSFAVLETLLGLGVSIYAPAGLSLLSGLFSSRERGRYIGIHEAAVPAGMTLGPIFAGLMLNLGFGWNRILQIWIIPAVVILISQLIFLRVKDGHPSLEDGSSVAATSKPNSWPLMCLLLLGAALFFRNVSFSEVRLLPVYWVSDLGVAVGTSAFIYGITRVFAIFGQVGAGHLSDIFGRFRVLLYIQILGTLLLVPTSYLAFGPLLFVSFSGFSILFNCYIPVMFALVSDSTHPKERPKNIGIVMSIGGISNIINPTILGLLAENYSFRTAWIYPISTGFISTALLLLLSRFKVRA